MSTANPPRLVLRFERSGLGMVNAITAHELRTGGDLRHCDPARRSLNRVLVGSGNPGADIRATVASIAKENHAAEVAALRALRRHKDARAAEARGPGEPWDAKNDRPLTRVLLSASPGWFEEDPARVDSFVAVSLSFLRERFGAGLVAASLHLDERTPHIHAEVLPLVEVESKRSGRRRMVSHRSHPAFKQEEREGAQQSYGRLQDEAAALFAPLGLVRGNRDTAGRPPKHVPVAEWRARQRAAEVERESKERARAALDHAAFAAHARAAEIERKAKERAAEVERKTRERAAEVERKTRERAAEVERAAKERAAEVERKTKERARAGLEYAAAAARGMVQGAAAVAAGEIVYAPAVEEKPDGLRFAGPALSWTEAARKDFSASIKPVFRWVVGYARRWMSSQGGAPARIPVERPAASPVQPPRRPVAAIGAPDVGQPPRRPETAHRAAPGPRQDEARAQPVRARVACMER